MTAEAINAASMALKKTLIEMRVSALQDIGRGTVDTEFGTARIGPEKACKAVL